MLAPGRSFTFPRALAVATCAALVVPLATAADAATGTVDGLSPTHGPVGTLVDITGSGLMTATDVLFNGTDAGAPTVIDDSHIQASVPTGATTGPVAVTTADGTVQGPPFKVQVPSDGTIAVKAHNVVFPDSTVVTATSTAGGVPVRHQRARLQRSVRGSGTWRNVQQAETTNKNGKVRWHVSPNKTSRYRATFSDSSGAVGSRTSWVRVRVHPKVSLHIPQVAPILTTITIKGEIHPRPADGHVVVERRRAGGSWERVARPSVRGVTHFRFDTSFDSTGGYIYRARRHSDATHSAGHSRAKHVRAVERTLRAGMSGRDVRALQRRLTALHYDVGGVTSYFNYDTTHAVVAFQKVNGLNRDGVVGLEVWRALDAPHKLQLHHPGDSASAGVEVDLKHQVVIYAVHSRIKRIFDASTGGGYYYTGSDGTQQRAITPTGHFHIVYKRDGWVTSDLGTLYRPAYFNYSGYAIHGEDQVPSYPASHGCVRITVPAMDRLNAKLPVGLSVWIY